MKRPAKRPPSATRTKRAATKPTLGAAKHWTDEGSRGSSATAKAGSSAARKAGSPGAAKPSGAAKSSGAGSAKPSTAAVAAATVAAQKQLRAATQRTREAEASVNDVDARHMRRALELAERFRGRTAPNPIVGCVIVDAVGNVIAEGAHRGPGTKHAEIDALDQLGGKAPGATLYCNLEPCTHQGRTPPCTPVVAAAGLARVVVGSLDPIASHAGGAARLAKQGIRVLRALEAECDLANLPFRTWALTRLPAFTLKAAMTLDGKIATVAGESKWITGEAAREHAHVLRSTHDAVLVGIGTVLADDPQLTARIIGGRNPVRVVVDSQLRTPVTAKVLQGGPRTIIATTERASPKREAALVAAGAEVWRFPATSGQVPLAELGHRLAEDSLLAVLVEGGGQIHAALLRDGLATDVQLFIAPKLVGGPAPSWVGGEGVGPLAEAWQLDLVGEPRRVGKDLLVRAIVHYANR